MKKNIDLREYTKFVDAVTSKETNNYDHFHARVKEIRESTNINPSLLLNSAIGLAAECGEFAEIPKKCFFQGKPLDEAAIHHMKMELSDIIWYWTNACRSLGLDPNDVIAANVAKLESRYPNGSFDPWYSENRKDGDL
jgi:NTP pyrophosphatase (non-canonical NTP hydrolase)